MRDYLARLLRTAGYEVDLVVDGQQALTAVRADLPDLVISDVMMPRLDGLALLAALRNDPRTAAVPRSAAVRARRPGGLDRGSAGRRRRLPRQTVRRRRAARAGACQCRTGAAAQPPRPLAYRADRLAAGGVLRLRRARRRHRDQHGVHRHSRLRRRRTALRADPPVVARRRHRSRGPPARGRGVRRAAHRAEGHLHRARHAIATDTGSGSPPASTTRKIPTPVAASWSAPSATSPPSTTPCNARPRSPR